MQGLYIGYKGHNKLLLYQLVGGSFLASSSSSSSTTAPPTAIQQGCSSSSSSSIRGSCLKLTGKWLLPGPLAAVACSEDGRQLALGLCSGEVLLWEVLLGM
jgi:hypothetical protein